jgi:DNA-binding LacI/PurR family transcriptional regulator
MSEKPTTIKKLAKILQISVSTVSRALNDHSSIGLATKARVRKLADELNYEPNQRAIQFLNGKSFVIGVILPELSESFFSAAITGIEDLAYKKNYTVLLAQSHDDAEREKLLVEKMKTQRVDGLLVSVSKTTSTYEHFEVFRKLNIPVVFFDRIPPVKDIHYVASNLETGTYEAVNFLLKKGHRAIGMINGPTTLLASNERKEGYIRALTANRLKFDPSLVVPCDLSEQGTITAMDTMLNHKRKPTSIVTFNDYVALFAMKYSASLQLQNLDFVSYANLPIIHYTNYSPIASVEQFPYKQGKKAAEILIDLINRPNNDSVEHAYFNIVIASQLVINKTE